MRYVSILLLFAILSFGTVFSSESKDKEMIVYSSNLAQINESREIYLPKNHKESLILNNFPSSMIQDSLMIRFGDDVDLYSKVFIQSNSVDMLKILRFYKSHKKEINFYLRDLKEKKRGYVILVKGSKVLVSDKEGRVYQVSLDSIYLDALPKELKEAKNCIKCKIVGKKGKHSLRLSYLVRDISWRASYTLELSKKAILNGWIDIDNQSGKEYKDIKLSCLAGVVHAKTYQKRAPVMLLREAKVVNEAISSPKRVAFEGYHIYKIPFRVDIPKGLEQIRFVSKKGIRYDEYGYARYSMPLFQTGSKRDLTISHMVHFKNDTNSLKEPLAAGKIRVFKDGIFIGEDSLPNTPVGSDIKVNIGRFFDIKVTTKQIAYKATNNRRYIFSKVLFKLSNKENDKRVIKLDLSYNVNAKISSSCKDRCKEMDLQVGLKRYVITLEGKSSYEFYVSSEFQN